MHVKLDAIDSTNEYLKQLSSQKQLENFTVVTAENQTNGRGQMGAVWSSEIGKNLIMSVLVKDFLLNTNQIFNLNVAFSVAIIQSLNEFNIPNLSVKWPNDIMSANKKIGGVLIENSFKSNGSIISVVGLGLNINQTNFKNLPKAASLSSICNTIFDKELVLNLIINNFCTIISNWIQESKDFWNIYSNNLFMKDIQMTFLDKKGNHFKGIIKGVSEMGQLIISLDADTLLEFNTKEIELLY